MSSDESFCKSLRSLSFQMFLKFNVRVKGTSPCLVMFFHTFISDFSKIIIWKVLKAKWSESKMCWIKQFVKQDNTFRGI